MIQISIPSFGDLSLKHLVIDYNGTLALDGKLLPGAWEVLSSLAPKLEIHILTADTYGFAASELVGIPANLEVLAAERQDLKKLEFVNRLGAAGVAAIGNGRNDRSMLKAAALGIAVIQTEGAAVESLLNADILSANVFDALDLLRYPKRLLATLRS
jgi:P-type E1-E2 ATPase